MPSDLAIICYPLDEVSQQRLLDHLLSGNRGAGVLWMLPGDDCSDTGFLMKVEDALEERVAIPVYEVLDRPQL